MAETIRRRQWEAINPDAIEAYRRQTEAFLRRFGREMGPDDPFFFDPDADTPRFLPPDKAAGALEFIANVMTQAGVDPAAVYAFRKTGGLLPVRGREMRPEDLAEWNAAFDEYYEMMNRPDR